MKRTTTWRSAGIHTEQELDRKGYRLDRVNRGVARVLAAMRRGATLHCTHRSLVTRWTLSNGASVSNEVVRAVITQDDVVGVGDSLFERELSQLSRYVESKGDDHV
jgi:hypothetical protein